MTDMKTITEDLAYELWTMAQSQGSIEDAVDSMQAALVCYAECVKAHDVDKIMALADAWVKAACESDVEVVMFGKDTFQQKADEARAALLEALTTGRRRSMTTEQTPHHQRRVVCAALRAVDGTVLVGIRHYSADMHIQIRHRQDNYRFDHTADQGFVDQWGKYMTRGEAYNVARAAGQIIRRVGGDESNGGTLYSENLY